MDCIIFSTTDESLANFRERLAISSKLSSQYDQMITFFRAVCDSPTFLTMLLQYRENLCQTEADKANFDKIMNFVVTNYTKITPLDADWGYYSLISLMKGFMPVPFGGEVYKVNTWRFAKGLPQFQRLPQVSEL
jgi:hypothetical protein